MVSLRRWRSWSDSSCDCENPMRDLDKPKQRAAERALEFVRAGQVIGLGTGSTAKFAIEGLGRVVRAGLSIQGVPTSIASERMATEIAIPLLDMNEAAFVDVTLDAVDDVAVDFNLTMGGAGALTRDD